MQREMRALSDRFSHLDSRVSQVTTTFEATDVQILGFVAELREEIRRSNVVETSHFLELKQELQQFRDQRIAELNARGGEQPGEEYRQLERHVLNLEREIQTLKKSLPLGPKTPLFRGLKCRLGLMLNFGI